MMASPKINRYVRISSELLEAYCKFRIPGEARQMLDVIIRKTYGYHKKEDQISTSQFMQLTGLSRLAVYKMRKKLRIMNLVSISHKGDSRTLTYSIQKDYEKWKVSPKRESISQKVTGVSPKRDKRYLPKGSTQKIIDIYTKERAFFLIFQDYLEMRKKIRKPATLKAQELVIKKLMKHDVKISIAMLEQSILNSWQGVFPLKPGSEVAREVTIIDQSLKSQDKIKKYRKDAEAEELMPKGKLNDLINETLNKKKVKE